MFISFCGLLSSPKRLLISLRMTASIQNPCPGPHVCGCVPISTHAHIHAFPCTRISHLHAFPCSHSHSHACPCVRIPMLTYSHFYASPCSRCPRIPILLHAQAHASPCPRPCPCPSSPLYFSSQQQQQSNFHDLFDKSSRSKSRYVHWKNKVKMSFDG